MEEPPPEPPELSLVVLELVAGVLAELSDELSSSPPQAAREKPASRSAAKAMRERLII
jgi:hypothetical protein